MLMQSTICVYFCADINLKLFYFIYSKYDRIKKHIHYFHTIRKVIYQGKLNIYISSFICYV